MANDPFWSNIFKRSGGDDIDLYEILKVIPIFQDLNRREFRKVEAILHRRTWGADEAIVNEGDPGVGMYIIVTGEVKIAQRGEDGAMQHLATLGGGDFFGEQALLDESPRTASAIAVEPCMVIGFFRPDLLDLIESNPRAGLKIVMRLSQMISVRLRQTNRLLKEARLRMRQIEREKEAREERERLERERQEQEREDLLAKGESS
jgi:CRP/FNR family cyclic AMP-dependent transcriptional regulator